MGKRTDLGAVGRAGGSWIPRDSFLQQGNLWNRYSTGKVSGFDGITSGISVFPTFLCEAKGFSLRGLDSPSLHGLNSHFMGWEKPWISPEWSPYHSGSCWLGAFPEFCSPKALLGIHSWNGQWEFPCPEALGGIFNLGKFRKWIGSGS